MELRQLEAFVAVATELHFGRAAEQLHLSQPTLSDLIRRLERELGTLLFTRTTRRVALTPAGIEMRRRADAILAEVTDAAAAVQRAAAGEAGTVRVGVTPPVAPVLAPHLAAALRAETPDVEITVSRMWLRDLERALLDSEVDVAITCSPVPGSHGAVSELLCGEQLLVGLRPDHSLAGREAVSLTELAGDTFGMPSEALFPAWAIAHQDALREAGVTPPVVELADTDLTSRRWAEQADVDWIMTTASVAAPDMHAVLRPIAPPRLIRFMVHWVPGTVPNPAVARFVRLARTASVPDGWVRL
ncbi:LysR family transcriptional regulator [Mycobacterium sp. WMMD1722]|uniref:LysR family transcriptional regulator n=1 Tax=Mycobacterium sp. WMMD1722 TaxID=3404117 RepID=UPI003BF4E687